MHLSTDSVKDPPGEGNVAQLAATFIPRVMPIAPNNWLVIYQNYVPCTGSLYASLEIEEED